MTEFDAYDIVATQAMLLGALDQRFNNQELSEINYRLSIQLVNDMDLAGLKRRKESFLQSNPDGYRKQREFVREHFEEAIPLLQNVEAYRELQGK